MIAAYSPQARGRSERQFRTQQARLLKEMTAAEIKDMNEANRYLGEVSMPAFNTEFMQKTIEDETGFVPCHGSNLEDILGEQYERVVGNDNCVSFGGRCYQIPRDQNRLHYVKVNVRGHRYGNGDVGIFHGSRKLAEYDAKGTLIFPAQQERAQPAADRPAAPTSNCRAHSRSRASAAPPS